MSQKAETTKDTKLHEGKALTQTGCAEKGSGLSWTLVDGVIELALHRAPCNELGSAAMEELEKFATALQKMEGEANFDGLQRFPAYVHALAAENRLPRFV